MRALTTEEIQTLMQVQGDIRFTSEEIAALSQGEASFKVFNAAEKALSRHKQFMMAPISRKEAVNYFAARKDLHHMVRSLDDRVAILARALMDNGVINQDNITKAAHQTYAEAMPDMCQSCDLGPDDCVATEETSKTALMMFNTLEGQLADKVIQCSVYRPRTEQKAEASNEESAG